MSIEEKGVRLHSAVRILSADHARWENLLTSWQNYAVVVRALTTFKR